MLFQVFVGIVPGIVVYYNAVIIICDVAERGKTMHDRPEQQPFFTPQACNIPFYSMQEVKQFLFFLCAKDSASLQNFFANS